MFDPERSAVPLRTVRGACAFEHARGGTIGAPEACGGTGDAP